MSLGVVELSAEQRAVFEAIETTREHIFVTGRAGTGKSTLLEHLAWHGSKSLAVCAPTGVAALNVGGQTIHSLFRLPIGVIANRELDPPGPTRKLLGALETLVVDEVSMVNADLLDAMDRTLRIAKAKPREPFGGVQLVLFGDPWQLSPVPASDPHERAWLADNYRSPWFFDAKVWKEVPLTIYELGEVHRQHEEEFRRLLSAVRHGRVTAEMAERLNEVGARPAPEEAITLAATNATVAAINAKRLAALPGRELTAKAEIEGEFTGRAYPADEELKLKKGARVMFLRNDAGGDGRWVNGSVGVVTRIADTVWVELDDEEHEVHPAVWEQYRYRYDAAKKELTRDVVAEFVQFPLRLAWAVTIHKSQGKSYDRALIDLGRRAFAPGQSYVALSRLTALDGLHLSRPLRPEDVIVDPAVRDFMATASPIPAAKA